MDCRMIWMPYQNCWNSSGGIHPAGGPGKPDKFMLIKRVLLIKSGSDFEYMYIH